MSHGQSFATPTYEELIAGFRWDVPEYFNLGVACCDAQAAEAVALVSPDGPAWTFGDLSTSSNRFGNALRALGVTVGDRVGIVLPQSAEAGIAHLAVYKIGAVTVPLSRLFGPEALLHRLSDSGARVVITDGANLETIGEVARTLGEIQVIAVARAAKPVLRFDDLLADASPVFEPHPTRADSPALLIYTSGTTGPPKGALHAHRVLLGHLPGFALSHDFFPQAEDRFWTPADWAWIGGLMDALLPTWYYGRPIVAAQADRFDPEWATQVIVETRARNLFLPPTALRLMQQAGVEVASDQLRTVMSGGEALSSDTLAWAAEKLNVEVNEIYGQTEANYVVGNSAQVWQVRPGSMGRPYPGHVVAVLDPAGDPVTAGTVGEVGVLSPDPVMFLEYWRQPDATATKFSGNWLLTGDLAVSDDEGYLWFRGRGDDLIISAGYRIGPEEIERCLARHDSVQISAVVGVSDPVRGEVIKAFVQLAAGFAPSTDLADTLRRFVAENLARFESPREISFVEEIPMTVTGKIRRSALREFANRTEKTHGLMIDPAGGAGSDPTGDARQKPTT